MSEVNTELTIDAVREFINSNKSDEGITGFIQDLTKDFIETEQGSKLIQPKLDSFFSKGLETWKSKSLPEIIKQEVDKRNPDETPEQKRIRELEEKLQAQERNAFKADLKSKTVKELSSNGLPAELSNLLDFNDEDSMQDSIKQFKDIFDAYVNKAVDDRFKSTGKTPDGKKESGADPKGMTREKLLQMSSAEATAFYNDNPEEFKRLMAQK